MDESILVDESVFDEAFISERLISREGQIKEIARCLAPARVGNMLERYQMVKLCLRGSDLQGIEVLMSLGRASIPRLSAYEALALGNLLSTKLSHR